MEKMKTFGRTLPWILLAAVLFLVNSGLTDAFAASDIQTALVIETEAAQAEGQEGQTETGEELEPAVPEPTETASLSCTTDGSQVTIQGSVSGAWSDPQYYDNYLYLFELQPYEDEIGSRTDYAGWIRKGDPVSFSLPLGFGTEADKLYSSFVLAVYDGTSYLPVSNRAYVSNPEAVARNTSDYTEPLTKKGLLLDGDMMSDAMELGVKNSSVSIAFHQILGQGIDYVYDGKTYHFNKDMIEYYDRAIDKLSSKDICVTAIILNGWNEQMPQLLMPGAKKVSGANYYAFNASTQEGVECIKAIASFLAERYSGEPGSKGKISNWIIGNEINNQVWNYLGPSDLDSYVEEYIRAFRVFYTAIRSVNKNDRLFFSTDFYWNETNPTQLNYAARDVIYRFAALSREGGDMDWGLAYHPYSDPLTEPEFWDDGATGRVVDSVDSYIVNFNNLHVLTDYFQRPELLDKNGQVRHIILSEQGFTSRSATRGDVEQIQAAALAYAYYIADSNPYIDAILMHRQVDNVSETNAYVAVGLWECDMSSPDVIRPTMRKKAWEVYKNIDKVSSLETTEFAKEIIGIEKWSDVIPNFKWARYE